jgi:predicted Ser/Thr protein kinase
MKKYLKSLFSYLLSENWKKGEPMSKSKKVKEENYEEIEERAKRLEVLIKFSNDIREKERRQPLPFNDFLYMTASNPVFMLRDIFQLFYDMVHYYVPDVLDDNPDDPESIGFVGYDCSHLFVNGCDSPFFADRLFANRLMNLVDSFKQSSVKDHIFLFEGPPGSGKSTFLNNILNKLEDYTKVHEGAIFKTYWRLDIARLGGFRNIIRRLEDMGEQSMLSEINHLLPMNNNGHVIEYPNKYLQFSCPKHDHPILQIPKSYRKQFLDELIPDEEFKEKLFTMKEYEWVLRDIPCNICRSLFTTLVDILGDPLDVFMMINARCCRFNRQFGEGVSVYNPGDAIYDKPIKNLPLQDMIHSLLRNDSVDFIYSDLAKTNNGVLALMDIKENNIERLKNLHGIISDGVHKVELIEEHIKSLFLGLVNPEDKVHYENVKSFQDRILTVNIPYILDYNTEVAIYKNKFGEQINSKFLPGVLENFAKIIISSRLSLDSQPIRKWLNSNDRYSKYTDKNYLLLKMDIYTGKIPEWLTEEDIKNFDKQTRKEILEASEQEGQKGFSGRVSINVFSNFYSKYDDSDKMITMEMVNKYFRDNDRLRLEIPTGFLESLEDMYNYNVLQEVKEAIYYYNEKQISKEIKNYLFAINYEPGVTEKSEYTGELLEITEDFFKNFEAMLLGTTTTALQRKYFRDDIINEYITKTLAQEIRLRGKSIEDTELYKNLFEKYTRVLKENALTHYIDNDNFRRAIIDFGEPTFKTYDERTRRDVTLLINNLKKKFKYTQEGAKQVSIYVMDKKLATKY